MKKKTSYLILISIIILGIIVDLVSKIIFANIFSGREDVIVVIPKFFELTYLQNTGAAYGMFSGHIAGLVSVSVLFIGGFIAYDIFNHSNSLWYLTAMGLIISGAIGNLIDRIFLGYVRDFLNIKLFSFVFNFADLFITAGVVCFVVFIIIQAINESKEKKGKETNDKNDNKC